MNQTKNIVLAARRTLIRVLFTASILFAGSSEMRAAEVWHFLDYWHFHRADNVELCQGQAVWQKDKTYVDPLRAKINDHLNSWATVWQDRSSGKWRMVYSAKWTPLTLMAAESDDGFDWRPLACPDIQPTGEKLAPHHIFTLPGGSGGGVYLDPEARDGFPFKLFAHQMGEVGLDGVARKGEFGGDLLVGLALGDEAQDIHLAVAQADDGIPLGKAAGELRRQEILAGCDAADGPHDDVLLAGFRNIAADARFHGTPDVLGGFVDRNQRK